MAGTTAGLIHEESHVDIQVIGAGAVNQAIKGAPSQCQSSNETPLPTTAWGSLFGEHLARGTLSV
jgi:hypothetical protein